MRTKHFDSIAAVLAYSKPTQPYSDIDWAVYDKWKAMVEQITLALATTNPHFDKARFLKAAGVEA